eukprot:TRINITY_DN1646_c0_g1_i1.p1 TRINITY_DN1646_c0_g1~~TRINITY_DN1646_c0_g1_i1.p1  ORF type:complete len:355 (+),score=69.11 TRINITY_DN1646_c0_g1_i1:68-1132(+)
MASMVRATVAVLARKHVHSLTMQQSGGMLHNVIVKRQIAHGTSDPHSCSLQLNTHPVVYTEEGNIEDKMAPLVLMVHGSPGSSRDFRHLAASIHAVSDGHARIVRLNLPGEGGSHLDGCPSPRSTALASSTLQFLATYKDQMQIRPESLTLVGHSMAGHVLLNACALELAVLAAEHPVQLSLLSPVSLRMHQGMRRTRPGLEKLLHLEALLPNMAKGWVWHFVSKQLRKIGFPRNQTSDLDVVKRSMQRAVATDFEEMRHATLRGLRNQFSLLAEDNVHLHFAYTLDDHLIEEAVFKEACAELSALPLASVTEQCFAEGGHSIQKTQAEGCATAIVSTIHRMACRGQPTDELQT